MTIEDRLVRVRNKVYIITMSHTSKTTWIAAGDYMGNRVEAAGSSATNAARRWIAAALWQGNGQSEPRRRVSQ